MTCAKSIKQAIIYLYSKINIEDFRNSTVELF